METVDCAKNALDKRTGGTVNGGVTLGQNLTISWGGRTATYHENGDVTGPIWGGALSSWLNMQINNRGAKNTAHLATNGWWKCGDTGFIRQWGVTPPLNAGQIYTVSLPCPVPHAIFSANATVKYKGIAPEGNLGTYVEIVGKSLIISADYTRTGIKVSTITVIHFLAKYDQSKLIHCFTRLLLLIAAYLSIDSFHRSIAVHANDEVNDQA
ncbi:hypothetical protein [Arsenophonus sp. PmNCSU2021_1]|uniref:hypothetical protein n=1 Tax=Arsenophonus sp. PmNCSU2021_1 TaxID=3118989 RepID=UPI002FF1FC75